MYLNESSINNYGLFVLFFTWPYAQFWVTINNSSKEAPVPLASDVNVVRFNVGRKPR